ncbi:MAG: hypothetical protein P8X64_08825 [Anaerolineales bacterium]|jgi:hypothetical protein
MNPNNRKSHRPAVAVWLLTGLAYAIWFGFEDRSLTPVVFLAALTCGAVGLTRCARFRDEAQPLMDRSALLRTALSGMICGAGVGPAASLLILIKTGLHSHPVPDFEPRDVLQVLRLSPAWAIAGGLIGLALGLLVLLNGENAQR